MERKKYLLITFFTFIFLPILGQTDTSIYKAYISGNMTDWKKYMDSYIATTNEQKMNLINYQYGYIGYCIDQDKDNEAEKYLEKAEALLKQLEKQQYKMSMIYAYKSAFVGFKIGLSPHKAPFIGQKSTTFAKKSIAADKTNYFGYIQLGNVAFYTPAMFGGSKTDAMQHYLKALELIEKDGASLSIDWNYLNLLSTIINAYYEIKEYEKARKYCIKALKIEPQFDWVKNVLYPKILKETAK